MREPSQFSLTTLVSSVIAILIMYTLWSGIADSESVTKEYAAPGSTATGALAGDVLGEANKPTFAADLISPRGFYRDEPFEVNLSDAVVQLDQSPPKSEKETELLRLSASYKAALGPKRTQAVAGYWALPSASAVSHLMHRFCESVSASLELAIHTGIEGKFIGRHEFIQRLYKLVGEQSPAAPYLAAALELAGEPIASQAEKKGAYLAAFRTSYARSAPESFYSWSEPLTFVGRFSRFLEREFEGGELETPQAILAALESSPELRKDYLVLHRLHSLLGSTSSGLCIADLFQKPDAAATGSLAASARDKGMAFSKLALFPPTHAPSEIAGSRLVNASSADEDVILRMTEQQWGRHDAALTSVGGWRDGQAAALEQLLAPGSGIEHQKVLFGSSYKQMQLVQAPPQVIERAMASTPTLDIMPQPQAAIATPKLQATLRVQPALTYYYRLASALHALAAGIDKELGAAVVDTIPITKESGPTKKSLGTELRAMRNHLYGLALTSAEDLGIPATAMPIPSSVNPRVAQSSGLAWLSNALRDREMAVDARAAMPIQRDSQRGVTVYWITTGVRLAKLDSEFAVAPQVRRKEEPSAWARLEAQYTGPAHYFMAIAEYATIATPPDKPLTTRELQTLAGERDSTEEVLAAIRSR